MLPSFDKKANFGERGIYDNEVLHVEGGVYCVMLEASCKCVVAEQMKYLRKDLRTPVNTGEGKR